MIGNNSPLEHLAAFAIAFAMGAVSTLAIAAYGARQAKQGAKASKPQMP